MSTVDTERPGRFDRGQDVCSRMALDERFDRELDVDHPASVGAPAEPRTQPAPMTRRSSSARTTQSLPASPNASLSLPSACLKLPFHSDANRSPSRSLPRGAVQGRIDEAHHLGDRIDLAAQGVAQARQLVGVRSVHRHVRLPSSCGDPCRRHRERGRRTAPKGKRPVRRADDEQRWRCGRSHRWEQRREHRRTRRRHRPAGRVGSRTRGRSPRRRDRDCDGDSTSGPNSATTCPSRASTCSPRSKDSRSTSPRTSRRAASSPCSKGSRPGPTIILRGDMDALPMPEDTGLDFASRVDGCMHACGHDTHTAMLAGAAHLLSERRDDLAGRVLFMFQPGEEGHHGARFMLDEGLLDVPKLSDGSTSAGRCSVRAAHHVGDPDRLGEHPRRGDHGVGRHDDHHGDRQGRPRQRAAPGARPDSRRLRDRAGAAADDHPFDRRVRPGRRHRRAHHRRHDEQRDPRDRRDRRARSVR